MSSTIIEVAVTDKALSQFQIDYVGGTSALVDSQWLQDLLRELKHKTLENKALRAKVSALEATIQLSDVKPINLSQVIRLDVHA